jgi:hypothetical protein
VNGLKYPKDLVSELECEDDLVDRAFSTPLLTDRGSEGYFKDGNKTTTL